MERRLVLDLVKIEGVSIVLFFQLLAFSFNCKLRNTRNCQCLSDVTDIKGAETHSVIMVSSTYSVIAKVKLFSLVRKLLLSCESKYFKK